MFSMQNYERYIVMKESSVSQKFLLRKVQFNLLHDFLEYFLIYCFQLPIEELAFSSLGNIFREFLGYTTNQHSKRLLRKYLVYFPTYGRFKLKYVREVHLRFSNKLCNTLLKYP